jgi:Ni,Fe-hydrogenase maturation factor
MLKHKNSIGLLALPQLGADLIEPLHKADLILFVDATIEELNGGWAWRRLYPETQLLPHLMHHIHPSFLLGLLRAIYHRSPPAWLVSIQGCDFGFEEGLSPEAEQRAEKVSSEIVQFIEKELTARKSLETDINTGANHGKRSRHPDY